VITVQLVLKVHVMQILHVVTVILLSLAMAVHADSPIFLIMETISKILAFFMIF
jgi:hypothetical protein